MAVVARLLPSPPPGPSLMRYTLVDVLFVHWPISASLLRPLVPLPLDLYGGQAWVTVAPFDLNGLRLRYAPPLPGLDSFAELDVRTYVTVDRKPGIWLLSADATSPLTVILQRWRRRFPYFHARTTLGRRGETLFYHCIRQGSHGPRTQFAAHYTPRGPVYTAEPGSLADFLLERYYTYSINQRGEVYRSQVNHRPWPLQDVSARIAMANLLPESLQLGNTPPQLHYCEHLDVHAWSPTMVAASTSEVSRGFSPRPRARRPERDRPDAR
jgi:uncharacterized protein